MNEAYDIHDMNASGDVADKGYGAFPRFETESSYPLAPVPAILDSAPAWVFDSLTGPGANPQQARLARHLAVVAYPGEVLNEDVRPGDLVLRRALGEGKLASYTRIAEHHAAPSGWWAGERMPLDSILLRCVNPAEATAYGAGIARGIVDTIDIFDTAVAEQVTPMTPAHAGGAMGELDAAFALGQQGFHIIVGPGGSAGHQLTASGIDIVAYNPATGQLWLIDNKASGGTSTVQSVSALTTNLEQNLAGAIRQIRSARHIPNRANILRLLVNSLRQVRAGQPLPSNVSRVVTNAGGYHSGISRNLRQQGLRFVDLTGAATRGTRRADIRSARQAGVSPGRSTTHTNQQQARPTNLAAPLAPPAPSARGSAIAAGGQLLLMGLNFGLNWLNDHIQRERVQQRLNQLEPTLQGHLQQYPGQGVLLAIYYHQVQAPPDSMIRPGPNFSHIRWAAGHSRDEAMQNLHREPVLQPAPGRNSVARVSYVWFPPRRPVSARRLRLPFRRAGLGTFATGRAELQDVEWGGVTGFDDSGTTRLNVAASSTPRFIILEPPREIHWRNGQFSQTTSIPLVTRRTAHGTDIRAVDLDPYMPFASVSAVPVFPYDNLTDRLFHQAPATRDNLNQLRGYPNMRKLRWIRPENIGALED